MCETLRANLHHSFNQIRVAPTSKGLRNVSSWQHVFGTFCWTLIQVWSCIPAMSLAMRLGLRLTKNSNYLCVAKKKSNRELRLWLTQYYGFLTAQLQLILLSQLFTFIKYISFHWKRNCLSCQVCLWLSKVYLKLTRLSKGASYFSWKNKSCQNRRSYPQHHLASRPSCWWKYSCLFLFWKDLHQ